MSSRVDPNTLRPVHPTTTPAANAPKVLRATVFFLDLSGSTIELDVRRRPRVQGLRPVWRLCVVTIAFVKLPQTSSLAYSVEQVPSTHIGVCSRWRDRK